MVATEDVEDLVEDGEETKGKAWEEQALATRDLYLVV